MVLDNPCYRDVQRLSISDMRALRKEFADYLVLSNKSKIFFCSITVNFRRREKMFGRWRRAIKC